MITVNIFDGGEGVSVFKAKIFHWRQFDKFIHPAPWVKEEVESGVIESVCCKTRGGKTEIWVQEEGDPDNYVGYDVMKTIAECSKKDNYSKKFGLRLCFGRFVKKYLDKKLVGITYGSNSVTLDVK